MVKLNNKKADKFAFTRNKKSLVGLAPDSPVF